MNRFISIISVLVTLCASSAQANNLIATFEVSGQNSEASAVGWMPNTDWYASAAAFGTKSSTPEANHRIGLEAGYTYRPENELIVSALDTSDPSYVTNAISVRYGEPIFDKASRVNSGGFVDQYLADGKRSDPADAGDLLILMVATDQENATWSNDNINAGTFSARDSWVVDAVARSDPADAGYLLQPMLAASLNFGM